MAEFLWTFAVQEVLKKTLRAAAQQIGLAWGFEKQLSNLTKSLLEAETILRDINRKKSHPDSVRLWVEDLQDFVYEADDLLDELVYENLRRKVEIGTRNKVRDSISKSYFLFRLKMAKKMKDITETLHDHYCKASPLGLVGHESTETNQLVLNQIRETTSNLNFEVVGRETEISKIVKLVIDSSNEHHMSIIPIVGMGGLGKTTLAQKIFNHEAIKRHFENIIWICISEPFIIINILEGIFQSLTTNSSGLNYKEALLRRLQEKMHGKKYFLVLDDVWNEEGGLWNELADCLKKMAGKSGNCIIVTTRSLEVANIVGTVPSHHLRKLSDDKCWFLFKESANADGLSMNPKLEIIREMLVKKIGGLPLVAKVLGGAIKFEGDYERWATKVESVVRNISKDDQDFVSSILKLSVDCLPLLSLKQCFAYFSNFLKDCEFDKEKLIRMWIAQGFIQPQDQEGDNEMIEEDIGEWHFNFLLSRSLFQDVVMDMNGRVTHFKIHDLMHDIACDISNHQKLLNELGSSNWSRKSARKLRTVICNDQVVNYEWVNCVSLRVVVFRRSSFIETSNFFDLIGKLKHLRYLDISKNFFIRLLPESITMLYNLQTLKLGRMKSLPKKLRKMVSLRHFEFHCSCLQMPSHMSRLIHLQTLPSFVAGFENGCKIEELGPLKNLKGTLELSCLEQVKSKEEAVAAKLFEKKNLHELILEWSPDFEGNDSNELEVLEGLQPHKNLQALTITEYRGQVLGDAIFVENLAIIHLRLCRNCEKLPMLGQLPNLVELYINSMDSLRCIGSEFYGNGSNDNQGHSFSKLRELWFIGLPNLEQWEDATVVSNSFGSLQTLFVSGCGNLKKLPNGLQCCSSLHDLTVEYCPKLSLNVQNMHNLSSLRINGLKKLPLGLSHLTNLKEMEGAVCMQDYDFTPFVSLQSLINLELRDECSGNCTQLSPHFEHLTALKHLTIHNFGGIEVVPEWLENLTSLKSLKFVGCQNLRRLPSREAIRRLTKLEVLNAIECPRLLCCGDSFAETGSKLSAFKGCKNFITLPWADQDDLFTKRGENDGSTIDL